MNKIREFLRRPAVTIASFALAVVLLAASGIGGARAALTVQSNYYNSEVRLSSINVALTEIVGSSGSPVSGRRALMTKLLGGDPTLLPGKKYTERLAVTNNGTIPEYVRVTVYHYWLNEDGTKALELDPELIRLGFVEKNGWSIDAASTTPERTVLYYATPLASGRTSPVFLESVLVDSAVQSKVTQTASSSDGLTTITTVYEYNGKQIFLDVHVDGVQTHSKDQAKLSAWGVNK